MEGQDIRGLIEAYSQVYETPEVLNEENLSEGPYSAANVQRAQQAQQGRDFLKNVGGYAGLSRAAAAAGDTAGAKRYMQKSQEIGDKKKAADAAATASAKATKEQRRQQDTEAYRKAMNPTAPTGANRPTKPTFQNSGGFGRYGAPSTQVKTPTEKPASTRPGSNTPAPTRPSATPAKPTNTQKPTAPAAPTKPAGSAMDQWAAANPKLAAAKAERDRTRGTSATTNPLMKDMKANLPAPKSPAPSTAKTGFDLAKKGVNLAADVDIFDIVKGHLLDEGYAETEENALVIMANMSEEWRQSIINEISKELATKAFATRARDAFEMDDNKQHDKADKTKERIVKKHGKEAGDEAEKAAERAIYGHNKYSEAQEREEEKKKSTKKEGIELEDILALNRKMERVYEAQRARENPEDHDKEEKRKYEPVRGEKTPMPPRGDKRREDFEKWYAKHVR